MLVLSLDEDHSLADIQSLKAERKSSIGNLGVA